MVRRWFQEEAAAAAAAQPHARFLLSFSRLQQFAAVLLAERDGLSQPLLGPLVVLLSYHSAW